MPSAQPPKRNQLLIIAAIVAALIVLAGVVTVVLLVNSSNKNPTINATDTTTPTEETTTRTRTTTTHTTETSQPPVNTANKWVVIVFSPATGAFGWSNNASSKDQATDMAMGYCKQYGGTDCQMAAWASNQCVALAQSDTNWHGGLGATIEAAEQNALTENKGGKILISKCST
jgi:hypothetical protein